MKIKTKIVLLFTLTAMVIMVLAVYIFYFFSAKSLRAQIEKGLDLLSYSEASHINVLLNDYKHDVEMISEEELIMGLLRSPRGSSGFIEILERISKRMISLEKKSERIYKIKILDRNGLVVFSTDERDLGVDKSKNDIFLKGRKETWISDVHFSETINAPGLDVASPVIYEEGFLGVVIIDFSMDEISHALVDKINLISETGESYLINSDGFMITPSRFVDDTFLKQKVETENSKKCFLMKEFSGKEVGHEKRVAIEHSLHEEMGAFLDYRGEKVLGSHTYLPEKGWCLLTEFNESEILKSTKEVLLVFVMGGFGAIGVFLLVAQLIAKSINKPIEVLRRGMEVVEGGNLKHRVKVGTKNEIGQLAKTFNKMTSMLKESRVEVEKKIKKQTRRILKNKKLLESQQKAILNVLDDVEWERKEAVREKAKSESLLESIGDGIIAVSDRNKILMMNNSAQGMLGIKEGEILDSNLTEVIRVADKDKEEISRKEKVDLFSCRSHRKKEISFRRGFHFIGKGDEYFPVRIIIAPIVLGGERIGSIILFGDVSEERSIDQAKTEFVSLASHQLRTPLSTINWYSEILLAGDAGKLNKEQKEHLEEIYNGSQRMAELVNALLNVSRIEMGNFSVEPKLVRIDKIVKDVLKELLPQIKKKKIKIKESYSKRIKKVNLDPKLIRIVFQNLLSNSVKYTKEKGDISVEIKKDKANVLVKVKDNGYGIAKKDHGKIFEKMFRADNVKEKDTSGTGLGLYIAKAIIEQSQGKIWFDSKRNKGTTFYFTLPIKGMKKREGTRVLL